ncbi:MAG: UDP-N-acetylmuramoyl-L-alanyl-D-glutamate--2,6-diaminopimelate ligase [candidate division Zixibacteria bacterium]|nr:UDP-N-acetylmuramoyl-L-alanyl-D-glutamate--2,6-diaminopimelate ligase [candidate division Zixibacteria bacterium]
MASDYKPIQLEKLFAGLDVIIAQDYFPVEITGLAYDSRRVKQGDLFFAIPGYLTDGAKFIAEAVSLGANAVATQAKNNNIKNVPVIRCDNIRRIMSAVASRFYDYPSKQLKIIGITGTNGKTTVCFLINHIMKTMGERWGNIGTVGYDTGKRLINALNTTPNSIDTQMYLAEMRDYNIDGCVMEVSSHGLIQHRCDDVKFSGAVFTNLTQDHLDYHKDMESYFKAKSILFAELLDDDGFAVLNFDDKYYQKIKEACRGKILSYSTAEKTEGAKSADIIIADKGFENNLRYFEASYKGKTITGEMPLLGIFNLYNAGAAIAAVVSIGCDFVKAVKALQNAPQVPGRVEKIEVGQPFDIIVDYAHTPDALENLLKGINADGDKILVFGCGGDRDKTKRPIMGKIAAQYADRMFVASDNPRTEDPQKIINDILKGIPNNIKYTVNANRDEAIGQALASAKKGDLVIIAGKGHEDYQIVGNTRHYFSDPIVIKKHLRKMGYEGS